MPTLARPSLATALSFGLLLLGAAAARADAPAPQSALSPEVVRRIDSAAAEVLATTGAPSASVAIVKDGRIAYLRAYGDARIEPRQPAQPSTRYAIGSISKQFTAAALLLLAQDGRLSLDDTVERWVPGLTRGRASRSTTSPARSGSTATRAT